MTQLIYTPRAVADLERPMVFLMEDEVIVHAIRHQREAGFSELA